MAKDIIIACDFSSKEELFNFLDNFNNEKLFLKIGMELFYSEGRKIVEEIKKRGHKIFLDLKLHDIPNTVQKAMSVLSSLDVDMINVHSSGGIKMMKQAKKAFEDKNKKPILISVTQLTSTSEKQMQDELLINTSLEDCVIKYAENTKLSGLDGVVCSPLESKKIKQVCGDNFITVTPGIRFQEDEKNDQVRITTPKLARTLGSDYIVVGRSITNAKDPFLAYKNCVKDFLNKEI